MTGHGRIDPLSDAAAIVYSVRSVSGPASGLVGSLASEQAFRERAHRLIPGGAHTYSRGDDQLPVLAPAAFVRGKGARVWSVSGTEYVDWGMGINNVLVGHAEDAIDDAAIAAIRDGQAFSRPSPLELDAAEMLLAVFGDMDMVKFAKNGSDANDAGIRLARAITGRDLVAYDASAPFLSINDWFIGTTVVAVGVPSAVRHLSVPFRFNDVPSLERVFAEHPREIAVVILEICRDVRPTPEFVAALRTLCDAHGTVLLFDEVVTAFRYDLAGAHALFGARPDLMSVGKAMANGYALSALLGTTALMERGGLSHEEDRIFFLSTTNGPERSALAAACATIDFYRTNDVIGQLALTGQRVMEMLADAAKSEGIDPYLFARSDFPSRPVIHTLDHDRRASPAFRTLFLQEMLRARVFMPWVCPSYRHGESELDQTYEAFRSTARVYARAIAARSVDGLLTGPAVQPVFRRRNRPTP